MRLEGSSTDPEPIEAVRALVARIAVSLVDYPEDVSVEAVTLQSSTILTISVAEVDICKLIGKTGRTIKALRSIVDGFGKKIRHNFTVEIPSGPS